MCMAIQFGAALYMENQFSISLVLWKNDPIKPKNPKNPKMTQSFIWLVLGSILATQLIFYQVGFHPQLIRTRPVLSLSKCYRLSEFWMVKQLVCHKCPSLMSCNTALILNRLSAVDKSMSELRFNSQELQCKLLKWKKLCRDCFPMCSLMQNFMAL